MSSADPRFSAPSFATPSNGHSYRSDTLPFISTKDGKDPDGDKTHTCDASHYNTRLCRFCRTWLQEELTGEGSEIPVLKGHHEGLRAYIFGIKGHLSCQGCLFLQNSVKDKLESDRYSLADVKSASLRGPYPFSWLRSRATKDTKLPDSSPPRKHNYENHTIKNVHYKRLHAVMEIEVNLKQDQEIVFMVQFEALIVDEKRLHSIGPWVKEKFDTSIISKWLDVCASQPHVEKTYYFEELTSNFRLMDLDKMCIVSGSSDKALNYVALSYMWPILPGSCPVGSINKLLMSNIRQLEQEESLKKVEIPVIKDSISLCKSLGVRYLWIDRFCIIQDDPNDRTEQIGSMNKIFSNAHFTLICALNFRDPQGLPGYTIKRDTRGVMGHLKGACIGNRYDTSIIDEYAQSTRWASRGWTFQELMLSQRRVFVTDRQLIFDCSCGFAQEMCTWSDFHDNEEGDNMGMRLYSGEYPAKALARSIKNNMCYFTAKNTPELIHRCSIHRGLDHLTRHDTGNSLFTDYSRSAGLLSTAKYPQLFGGPASYPGDILSSCAGRLLPPISANESAPDTPDSNAKIRSSTSEMVRETRLSMAEKKIMRRFFQQRELSFYDYIEAVQNYSRRRLTDTSDSINAFAGIASRFRASSQVAQGIYHGFLERFFIKSLFWRRPMGRNRVHIHSGVAKGPSWSWARRFDEVEFVCTETSNIVICSVFSRVFYMHPTAGAYLLKTSFREEMEEKKTLPPGNDTLEHDVLDEARVYLNSLVFKASVVFVNVKVNKGTTSCALEIYDGGIGDSDNSGNANVGKNHNAAHHSNDIGHRNGSNDPFNISNKTTEKVARKIGAVCYDSLLDMDTISCDPEWCEQHDYKKDCSFATVGLIFCQEMTESKFQRPMELVIVVKGQTVLTKSNSMLVCSRVGFATVSNASLSGLEVHKKEMTVILK